MDKHPLHSQHQTTIVLLILFFFLIGKDINLLIENVIVCIKHAHCDIKLIQYHERDKEEMNSITFVVLEKLQVLDQSKRVVAKLSISWFSELEMSSKVRRSRSIQIKHITHKGTRFQTSDE